MLSRPRLLIAAALVVVVAVVAVLLTRGGSSAPDRVPVATALAPLDELVRTIGGDRVRSTDLTPVGGQPHGLVLSDTAGRALRGARIVVFVGGGFQPSVDAAVARLGPTATKLDVAGEAPLPAADVVPGGPPPMEGRAARDAPDPHAWLDPRRYAGMAREVQAALAAADPDHAEEYAARGRKLTDALTALDRAFASGLSACRGRTMIATHPAWAYLADRYGLEQRSVGGIVPGAAPAPEAVRAVKRLASRADEPVGLFTAVPLPSRVAERIASQTGAKVEVLNPLEGLTQDQLDRGDGYVPIMRANLAALQRGLDCGSPASTTPGGTTPAASTPPTAG